MGPILGGDTVAEWQSFFHEFARKTAHVKSSVAVIESDTHNQTTFEGLLLQSQAVASLLASDYNLKAGDILAVWVPNSIAGLVAQLAASLLNVKILALNTRYQADELREVFFQAPPKAILYDGQFMNGRLAQVLKNMSGLCGPCVDVRDDSVFRRGWSLPDSEGEFDPSEQILNVFVTSGTTSTPKLVAHTQASVTSRCVHAGVSLEWNPQRRLLGVLPLCGVFGFNSAWGMLFSGGTVVTMRKFDEGEALRGIEREEITDLVGSDTMFWRLIHSEGAERSMRTIQAGTFANFTGRAGELIRLYEEKLGVKLVQPYGSSELQALMSQWRPDESLEVRQYGGGHLLTSGIQIRVVDVDTGETLGFGKPGEVQAKGREMFSEYLGNPDKTREVMTHDGWFKTGDMGSLREDGSFIFYSRIKDGLRLGGFLVDPGEIESHLTGLAGILDAQVVGVKDPNLGDVAVAFVRVKSRDAFDENLVRKELQNRVASYKVPRYVRVVDEFPMTAAGTNGEKIQKAVLRRMGEEAVEERQGHIGARRIIIEQFGGPEVLVNRLGKKPIPGPTEVVLKIQAAGVCRHDLLTRSGAFPNVKLPVVLGHQGAGVVEAVGSSVSTLKVGQRAMTLIYAGCGTCDACERGEEMLCRSRPRFLGEDFDGVYQDYVLVPESLVIPLPDSVAMETAAVLTCTVGTAYHAIVTRGRLKPGETVVITGASGGVGSQTVLIAKAHQARVIALTSSSSKAAYLKNLGADDIIVAKTQEFANEVKTLTRGMGADMVIDIVGARTISQSLRALKFGGRMVVVGNVDGGRTELNPALLILKEVSIIGTKSVTRREMEELLDLVRNGTLVVPDPEVMEFEQAREAHQKMEEGKSVGRIVLKL